MYPYTVPPRSFLTLKFDKKIGNVARACMYCKQYASHTLINLTHETIWFVCILFQIIMLNISQPISAFRAAQCLFTLPWQGGVSVMVETLPFMYCMYLKNVYTMHFTVHLCILFDINLFTSGCQFQAKLVSSPTTIMKLIKKC